MTLKRDAVNVRESIVTEDIGKMPDLNLAEAIQRVPGVTIVREGGEGRQLSLRGLGADFTQVTLNGMEVPASTGGLDSSGAINRGRAFDFNVFPAELFSRIDINKSLVASIEEGGVGGAVQMYTAGGLDSRRYAGVGPGPDGLQRPVGGVGSAVHGNLHHGEQGEDPGLHDLRGADGAQLLAGWFRHRPLAEAGRELQGERDDAEQPAAPVAVVPAPAPPGQLPARPGAHRAWRARSSSARPTGSTST